MLKWETKVFDSTFSDRDDCEEHSLYLGRGIWVTLSNEYTLRRNIFELVDSENFDIFQWYKKGSLKNMKKYVEKEIIKFYKELSKVF